MCLHSNHIALSCSTCFSEGTFAFSRDAISVRYEFVKRVACTKIKLCCTMGMFLVISIFKPRTYRHYLLYEIPKVCNEKILISLLIFSKNPRIRKDTLEMIVVRRHAKDNIYDKASNLRYMKNMAW